MAFHGETRIQKSIRARKRKRLGIEQPEWRELINVEDAKAFARRSGYPLRRAPQPARARSEPAPHSPAPAS